LSYTNDSQTRALKEVDANRPGLPQFTLVTPQMAADASSSTWGRYVQNVPGPMSDINIKLNDPDGDLYGAAVEYPSTVTIPFSASGANKTLTIHNFDFSSLSPTTANNPNQFRVVAEDVYGLHSDPAIQTIEVVPQPPWLGLGLGQQTNNSIKFDAQN